MPYALIAIKSLLNLPQRKSPEAQKQFVVVVVVVASFFVVCFISSFAPSLIVARTFMLCLTLDDGALLSVRVAETCNYLE